MVLVISFCLFYFILFILFYFLFHFILFSKQFKMKMKGNQKPSVLNEVNLKAKSIDSK